MRQEQVSKRRPRQTENDANNEDTEVTVSESVSDKLRSANEFLTRVAELFGYMEP